jgi:hypothetical protein
MAPTCERRCRERRRGSAATAALRAVWHQGPTQRQLTDVADPAVTQGRYHAAGGIGTWFGSSQEQAAWAELFRHFLDEEVDPCEVRRLAGHVEVD